MSTTNETFLTRLPDIQERQFKYRNRMESHALNELQDEAFKDILTLFNQANEINQELVGATMTATIESACYSQRLEKAIADVALLAELYRTEKLGDDDMRQVTRYAFQASTEGGLFSAAIDLDTNDVTPRVSTSVSKTHLYDSTYGKYLVPPSLKTYIGPDAFSNNQHVLSIEDTDIRNAFNNDDGNVWCRKIVTDTTMDSVQNEVVIGLPEDIITSRLVNTIILKPFPTGYIDVVDVMYKANGAWTTIPGFKAHYGSTMDEYSDIFGNTRDYDLIEDAPNLRFNFQDITTNQVKIILRQRHYQRDDENNRRIWYLGLRNVDVLYNTYNKNPSDFYMDFEFPETDRRIKIYDTSMHFNNEQLATGKSSKFNVTKEYMYFDTQGATHKVPASCPFILEGHKVRVGFTIEGGGLVAPNLMMAKVLYKTV